MPGGGARNQLRKNGVLRICMCVVEIDILLAIGRAQFPDSTFNIRFVDSVAVSERPKMAPIEHDSDCIATHNGTAD